MIPLQPVTGFFKHVAEAQQAVQLLLSSGFTSELLSLSTQSSLRAATDLVPPTSIDGGSGPGKTTSGYFLFSLFGNLEGAEPHQPDPNGNSPSPNAEVISLNIHATVTVQVQSTTEAERATELLCSAGATTD